METFSLLKYWRGGGGGDGECDATRAIVTTVAHSVTDTDDDGDDGPFFDLEFGLNEEDGEGRNSTEGENASDFGMAAEAEDDEDACAAAESDGEFDFTLSSTSSSDGGNSDVNLSLSPADNLFFQDQLFPAVEADGGDPNSKPQFPVSLMKSATKFRVFMLGLKKARAEQKEPTEKSRPPEEKQAVDDKKMFAVKFKVEEVPIKSLFTREKSSRSFYNLQKRNPSPETHSVNDDKLFSKEAVQRYLKKVKPLYVRVSRRYGEKLRLSGQLAAWKFPPEKSRTEAPEVAEPDIVASPKVQKPAGLREVCKHLGKSRSASAAVAAVPGGSRRDDSLLEQQDGIQGAILHCKRSFNASRESESSMFLRSVSDLLQDKSPNLPSTKSSDEVV